ncbi:hypothetical protein L228DRAFT_266329 [Xylona heveae TC161]|uniref:Uncharacterized protein n=1 Tax=Xylona heveae (strain CBS 132557 / TC161) TaxID=1328760 RepID=A0A165HUX1_XYLHT|nr:hypothetical protein L228DRAFT_266329 [Xylona heveae TC161]KZF23955.1 hypothetical protein L228DRAFT_266329 [Xylona heveae TC161]
MSATRNTEAVAHQTGEFSAHVPRAEPMTTHGHQPGRKSGPNDNVEEYHAHTLPAGTAPPEHTFQYQTQGAIPGQEAGELTSAADTLGGATSADVNTGYGHPGQGQTSSEKHHGGQHHATKAKEGLTGTGVSGLPATNNPVHGQHLDRP